MCSECDALDRTITDADLAPFAFETSGPLRAATLARAVQIVRHELRISGSEMARHLDISRSTMARANRSTVSIQRWRFEHLMTALADLRASRRFTA